MKLGGKFWVVLIASIVGVVVAGAIVVALFGWAWYELGFLGAFLILSGIVLPLLPEGSFPELRARSVQFHPEAGPGPHDAWPILQRWVEEVRFAAA